MDVFFGVVSGSVVLQQWSRSFYEGRGGVAVV
jgi:hypothetical protein